MTRTALAPAVLALLVIATPADAGPPPRFQPFNGVSPEQFRQSSVARWADQLVLELASLKADVAKSPAAGAINPRADRASQAAVALGRAARKSAPRADLDRHYAAVEAEVAALDQAVGRHPAAGQAMARVHYAHQQLFAALTATDPKPEDARKVAARLAGSLDDQAERLRAVAAEGMGAGYDPALDGRVKAFSADARKLAGTLSANAPAAAARADFATVSADWGAVAERMTRTPNLPAAVRFQAARVEGLFRKLADRMGGVLATPMPANAVVPPNANGVAPPPVQAPDGWVWDPAKGWVWEPDPRSGGGQPIPPPPSGPGFNPIRSAVMAFGAAIDGGPRVRVFHDIKANASFDFFAFDPDYRGGVRVAVADLNGDGIPDIVTAPGPNHPPLVRVFDGRDMSLLTEFLGHDPNWGGGLHVAATDLTRDGRALVAVAPEVGGGPHVKVFDLAKGKEVANILAYPADLRGGARVAWGDLDGDGNPELVTVPGPCDFRPVVRVFDSVNWKPAREWLGSHPDWRGGLWVAAGPGVVAVGHDIGGGPQVKLFDPKRGRLLGEWLAFPDQYRGGVRVAIADADADGTPDVIAAAGPGLRGSPLRVFGGKDRRLLNELPAYPDFDGGSFVGGR